jgi:hypothetical protein
MPMRVTFDVKLDENAVPMPTWQPAMFPGIAPFDLAEQGALFDLGQPEPRPATRPDDPDQSRLFS